ncbi:MAG: PAS domain-containing sensor histidine kinase, partial [Agriterribacter sp.]
MIGHDGTPVDPIEEIKQLKAQNAALKEHLQYLNTITMANADMAYKMNADWSHMLELNAPDFLVAIHQPDRQWLKRYILPKDRPRVLKAIKKAIAEKQMFELEHLIMKADGRKGWTLSRAIPVLDQEGNITEWLGLGVDITARKQAELDLLKLMEGAEQQKRLYETIIGTTPDLVYVFDLDARFSYANEALLTMWGRTKDNSFGKSLLEVGYEPWHAAMHEREIEHIKKTKETVRGEVAFPHATLGKRIYDYILVPVLDAKGRVTAIAGTTRDITEIRKLSEQKDEFLTIASHELKTPLTSVKAYAQVLKSIFEDRNDAEAAMILGRMDKQINKLTGFITDLLDVTRIQSGKLQYNHELFDLSALAVNIVDELQLTTAKHLIKKDLPARLLLYADMERIGQVITNLVTNAIKYSPAGGDVQVTIREYEDQLLLSVKDFGIGIPADRKSKAGLLIRSPGAYHLLHRHKQRRPWRPMQSGVGSSFRRQRHIPRFIQP